MYILRHGHGHGHGPGMAGNTAADRKAVGRERVVLFNSIIEGKNQLFADDNSRHQILV
jgi:hypothetical protein